jgi:hypothetical protein
MKPTEDVLRYASARGIAGEEAQKKAMEDQSKEVLEKGAEVCAKV